MCRSERQRRRYPAPQRATNYAGGPAMSLSVACCALPEESVQPTSTLSPAWYLFIAFERSELDVIFASPSDTMTSPVWTPAFWAGPSATPMTSAPLADDVEPPRPPRAQA